MKDRITYPKTKSTVWDEYVPPEVEVTQSQELKKETNFKDLPDGTQIVSGTKNISEFGQDIEFIAPFVCIMAAVVAKKYGIVTWTGDIVDYILKCGNELYGASKLRYDQVNNILSQRQILFDFYSLGVKAGNPKNNLGEFPLRCACRIRLRHLHQAKYLGASHREDSFRQIGHGRYGYAYLRMRFVV